jgi:hypothetical protein
MDVRASSRPLIPGAANPGERQRRTILLTTYNTGSTSGKNLGVAGYSYDFVAQLFRPLLERCGEVIWIRDLETELEPAIQSAREWGSAPVHVGFMPFQDTYLSPHAPNVIVPAWEYPDVPNHKFDGNPQNDWVATANRCDLVIVGGEFTADAFARAGVRAPVRIVPVPTPEAYFEVAPWTSDTPRAALRGSAYIYGPPGSLEVVEPPEPPEPVKRRRPIRSLARHGYRRLVKPLLPRSLRLRLRMSLHSAYQALRDPEQYLSPFERTIDISRPRRDAGDLARGVVYTSVLNPADGRKNWQDLLTGFLFALGDRDDATLIVKLINRHPFWINHVLEFFQGIGRTHRCTVAFVSDYLTDEQMVDLAAASTYYVTTTRAEGNCLPLMNYLAAGRPGISPSHTAISDYFGAEVGFVVDSHPEPTAWPHDRRFRRLTTWHRLVWPSLVDRFRESYETAKHNPRLYDQLSARARETMAERARIDAVLPRLREALDLVAPESARDVRAA